MGLVTALTRLDDERLLIETQDCRSEFAFEEFCDLVSKALRVTLSPTVEGSELAPRSFSFEGETFTAGWEDEFGCFIEGREAQRATLERMRKMLLA